MKDNEHKWIATNDELPTEGETVLGRLIWDRSGKETYAVLEHKTLEDNAPWLYDGSELSFWVNVTHWKRFESINNKTEGEHEDVSR